MFDVMSIITFNCALLSADEPFKRDGYPVVAFFCLEKKRKVVLDGKRICGIIKNEDQAVSRPLPESESQRNERGVLKCRPAAVVSRRDWFRLEGKAKTAVDLLFVISNRRQNAHRVVPWAFWRIHFLRRYPGFIQEWLFSVIPQGVIMKEII